MSFNVYVHVTPKDSLGISLANMPRGSALTTTTTSLKAGKSLFVHFTKTGFV